MEIVITVEMQFLVGFEGSKNTAYRKRVVRCGWVGKLKIPWLGPMIARKGTLHMVINFQDQEQ